MSPKYILSSTHDASKMLVLASERRIAEHAMNKMRADPRCTPDQVFAMQSRINELDEAIAIWVANDPTTIKGTK